MSGTIASKQPFDCSALAVKRNADRFVRNCIREISADAPIVRMRSEQWLLTVDGNILKCFPTSYAATVAAAA